MYIVGLLSIEKNASIMLTFSSRLCLALRKPNLLKFLNLVNICVVAAHFRDYQFLLNKFTSAPTVEFALTGIHSYKLNILDIF